MVKTMNSIIQLAPGIDKITEGSLYGSVDAATSMVGIIAAEGACLRSDFGGGGGLSSPQPCASVSAVHAQPASRMARRASNTV